MFPPTVACTFILTIALGLSGCIQGSDGVNGVNGVDGAAGAAGANGADGADGVDGLGALVTISAEPVGVNCANGGFRVDAGVDTNRNGSLDAGEITETGFACNGADGGEGWQVATVIELDNTGDATLPHVAIDDDGNSVAVWQQHDGARYNVWSNRYVSGIGWGTAELIEADDNGGAADARVVVDGSGNAIAVWEQSDGTRFNIWANRYVAGVGWGVAELIETDNAANASNVKIGMDDDGNAIAVWEQSDGARFNIWANRYVAGVGWGVAELIESDNSGGAAYAAVAVDGSGNAIAVWEQSDGTRDNIWVNRYVVGVGWGAAALIETDNAGGAANAAVAVDGSGNAIAVWEQSDGTRDNIWANRYVVGVGWGVAALIESDNAGNAGNAAVAVDAAGNAIAVWEHADGTRDNIWANRYVVGTGWGTAQRIETDNAGSARGARVAVDNNGNATVVWSQLDAYRENVWANRYVVGAGWGTAGLIETESAGDARNPAVAVNGSGGTVAVWQQDDGTQYDIWANRR